MASGPPKTFETVVAVVIPPACREEVLGDRHEQYSSAAQYGLDAASTVPLVILSRIHRTADSRALLIQAFAFYASFLAAAWINSAALLRDDWGLLRLAIPAAAAMLGVMGGDAYASPPRGVRLEFIRAPVLGVGFALAFEGIFWIAGVQLALPRWIFLLGSGISLLLSCALRISIPPAVGRLQEASTLALATEQTAGSPEILRSVVTVLRVAAIVVVMVMVSTWLASYAGLPAPRIFVCLSIPWVVYEVWKRT